jgi:hypothetical protein
MILPGTKKGSPMGTAEENPFGTFLSKSVGVPLVQVGEGSVECNEDLVICGFVAAICELEWVQGVRDDGVAVSHDLSFKAFHGYRCECYGAVVI